MIRTINLLFTLVLLVACSEPAPSPKVAPSSCEDVLQERDAYRKDVQRRAQQLRSELNLDQSKPDQESYPKLADSQKFLEFQAAVEAHENMFTVRLNECAKASNAAN